MYDALIKLNSIKDLYSFVDILDKHSGTFEIVANDYVVDARSLMSMLSLDLSKPLELSFDSDEASVILSQLQPFILRELSLYNQWLLSLNHQSHLQDVLLIS